jgi:CheY-like chemotaxis protein
MAHIRLIHWNAAEAEQKAEPLRSIGYEVDCKLLDPAEMKALKQSPPDAAIIDLTRMPSQGRDIGIWLRREKSTRQVPLIFVDGLPEKTKRVRDLLPDAVYTTWSDIKSALEKALSQKPTNLIVPASVFEAYKTTPLPKKLGIKPGSTVALIDAPKSFEKTLGELPKGAILHRGKKRSCELAIWFVKSRRDLEARMQTMAPFADQDGLWIAWPKKSSELASDLTQVVVRRIAETAGLVDYKISAIDRTWSGLRFTFKKSKK